MTVLGKLLKPEFLAFLREHEPLRSPTKVRTSTRVPDAISFHRAKPENQTSRFLPTVDYMLKDKIYFPTHIRAVNYNRSASAGLWFKRRGYKTQGDVLDDEHAMQLIYDTAHNIKEGQRRTFTAFLCCVSAKKDVETGHVKYRDAWVYDMSLLAMEKMFVSSIKYNHEEKVPSPLLHSLLCAKNVMSLDITKFDAQISASTIRRAFTYLRSKFNFSLYLPDENEPRWRRPYSANSIESIWNVCVYNFIHTRYRNSRYSGQVHRGIPSGSAFTNIIATICSNMIAHAVVDELGLDAYVHTHGDDTYIIFPSEIDATNQGLITEVVQGYQARGLLATVASHLPWGCHITCKTWCVKGEPFHPGVEFSNILSTLRDLRYWNMVLKMLISFYDATDVQRRQLDLLWADDTLPPSRYDAPFWLLRQLTRGAIAE